MTRGTAGVGRAVGPRAGQRRIPLAPQEGERFPASFGPAMASVGWWPAWCSAAGTGRAGRVLHGRWPASASAVLPNCTPALGRKAKAQPGLPALSLSWACEPGASAGAASPASPLLLSPITGSRCPSWLRALPARHWEALTNS